MSDSRFMGFVLRKTAGMWVLLDVRESAVPCREPLIINGIGAEIFAKLKEGSCISDIIKEIAAEYDSEQETVKEDVEAFVNELRKFGVPV